MLEIIGVLPGSTAEKAGLSPGRSVVTVNGHEVNDIIDYRFFSAEERLSLVVRNRDGTSKNIRISKSPDDNLGLEFSPLRIRRCRNNCVFCFVSQMPQGCRRTLNVKDDDFRASFLYGNFITLTNLTQADWDRIFRQRLSPLYVSVHATDPAVRAALIRNKKASPIIESLRRLASGGIRMHAQIVLCPGINDEEHLARTITDLSNLFPMISSIAVVPVGITRFRKNLFPLRTFTKREARAALTRIRPFAERFRKQFGTRLVFASDELYVKSNERIPAASSYEDFPQIENGVGMAASFLQEVFRTRLPKRMLPVRATVVTGVSFGGILSPILNRVSGIEGVSVKQVAVKNEFFGAEVTVTGLLTGKDILNQLKGKRLGDMVVVPSNVLKEDEPIFLDGMPLEDLQKKLRVNVLAVEGFRDFLEVLRKKGRNPA